jgi:predicted acyltransferase
MNATLPLDPSNQDDQPHAAPSPATVPHASSAPAVVVRQGPARLVSLDAYRGLTMILMVSAGLYTSTVAKSIIFDEQASLMSSSAALSLPPTAGGGIAGYASAVAHLPEIVRSKHHWWSWWYQTDHAEWRGCTLWDMIQPSFMFMVGAAVPFSIAARRAKGHRFGRLLLHAAWRAGFLVLLAVFLSSDGMARPNWIFTNVLAQIGLGYLFLFCLAWVRVRWQIAAAAVILVGYWLAFALWPATPDKFDFNSVKANGHQSVWAYPLDGFERHWDKNTNIAAAADRHFLNWFPRHDKAGKPKPFEGEEGGYTTLNFVPSLATMLFGLLAGQLLMAANTPRRKKLAILVAGGLVGLGAGWTIDRLGLCPIIKRIWTPSWAIFSTGWALLALATFYFVCDVVKLRRWAFPLVVVGMNSIAVYCLSQTMKPWFRDFLKRHLGEHVFEDVARKFGDVRYAPIAQQAAVLLIIFGIALWMHRRRVFLKI